MLGRIVEAEEANQNAMLILGQLAKENKKNERYLADLAVSAGNLADIFKDTKRNEKAVELLRDVVKFREDLASTNPDPEYRFELGKSRLNLAIMLGSTKEAEEEFARSQAIFRELSKKADDPLRPQYEQELCVAFRSTATSSRTGITSRRRRRPLARHNRSWRILPRPMARTRCFAGSWPRLPATRRFLSRHAAEESRAVLQGRHRIVRPTWSRTSRPSLLTGRTSLTAIAHSPFSIRRPIACQWPIRRTTKPSRSRSKSPRIFRTCPLSLQPGRVIQPRDSIPAGGTAEGRRRWLPQGGVALRLSREEIPGRPGICDRAGRRYLNQASLLHRLNRVTDAITLNKKALKIHENLPVKPGMESQQMLEVGQIALNLGTQLGHDQQV